MLREPALSLDTQTRPAGRYDVSRNHSGRILLDWKQCVPIVRKSTVGPQDFMKGLDSARSEPSGSALTPKLAQSLPPTALRRRRRS